MAMKIANCVLILLFLAAPLRAETGQVVKTHDDEVLIDISEFREKPVAGSPFVIYEPGEELVNPSTGKKLGAELKRRGKGSLTEIHDTYAKGRISESSAVIKPGFVAEFETAVKRLTEPAAPPANTLPAQTPVWESEPVPGITVDAAPGDFDGDGLTELAVAQAALISIFRRDGTQLVAVSSAALPAIQRIVSIETLKAGQADLKTDALIINIFDSASNQVEAGIYALENGTLTRKDQLKWIVRALNAAGDAPAYYTQEIYQSQGFRLSFIKPLEYRDGFRTGSARLTLPRADWLYGLTVTDLDGDGKNESVYTTPGGSISVQFEKRAKHADTRTGFSRTPNRANIKNTQLYFNLRLPVVKTGKTAGIYGVSNIPAHMLSEAFGKYSDADLCRFAWNGAILTETGRTRLGGAVWNINYGSFGGLEPGLIIPVTTIDDATIIKVFGYQ
ncbi:MAG: VCBS repeat-containing protein [Elusimicrobiaceae bacterium]|nr:VCBS repeat-containing protein [Elusimicrobiaceae bacterium]